MPLRVCSTVCQSPGKGGKWVATPNPDNSSGTGGALAGIPCGVRGMFLPSSFLLFFLPIPLGTVCHPLCSLALTSVSPLHPTPPGPAGSSPMKAFAAVWLIVLFRVSCCVCLCSAKIMVQSAWRAGALQQRSLGPPPAVGGPPRWVLTPSFWRSGGLAKHNKQMLFHAWGGGN